MEIAKLKVRPPKKGGPKVPGQTARTKREGRLFLPTEKSLPDQDMSRFKYYFFGGRKVGKTSFVSEFPDCLNIFTEPSGSDYNIYAVQVYEWADVLDLVDDVEAQAAAGTLKFKNVSFDIVDKAYKWLIADVCLRRGCAEEDLGWGWDQVKQEFESIINRLAKFLGVIFVSHVKEREIPRADGTKYEVLMPSSMKNCYELISSICDMTGYFYMNPKNKRLMRILPHMESTTGNRFENHFNFKDGSKIDEIDMGLTKKDAFSAFQRAFNNDVEKSLEVEEIEEVSDEAVIEVPKRTKFKSKGK